VDTKIGNARRFALNNHRLDRDAVLEMQDDPRRALTTALGGISGHGRTRSAAHVNIGGCLSKLEVNAVVVEGVSAYLEFPSPAVFFIGGHDTDNRPIAKHVNYEPSSSAQSVTALDISVFAGANSETLLWIQRGETPVDEDNQVNWNLVEQDNTTELRFMEYVDFRATLFAGDVQTNDPANGWAVFGRIFTWDGWTPTIEIFDPVDFDAYDNYNLMVYPVVGAAVPAGYALGIGDYRGIYRMLKTVVNALLMQFDSDWDIDGDGTINAVGLDGYYRKPTLGHKQLDSMLAGTRQAIGGGTMYWNGATHVLHDVWAADGLAITLQEAGAPAVIKVDASASSKTLRNIQFSYRTPNQNSAYLQSAYITSDYPQTSPVISFSNQDIVYVSFVGYLATGTTPGEINAESNQATVDFVIWGD